MPPAPPPAAVISTDLPQVDRLLGELEQHIEKAKLSLEQQEDYLARLKGIETLSKYALETGSPPQSYEALRVLANAFLLHPPSRQVFVDLGYPAAAADLYQQDDREYEFLIGRMLFLLTYDTTVSLGNLVEQHGLADSIIRHVTYHSKIASSKSGGRMSATLPVEEMAMIETLKLLFNITYHAPDLVQKFTSTIEPLVNIIMQHPLPDLPLDPPIRYVLNALLNLDLKAVEKRTPIGREPRTSPVFPYSDPEGVIDRLVGILDSAARAYSESDLDQTAAPLVTLIRRCYDLATPQMQAFMRQILLPREKDRDKPLGQGDTISARLLRLSSSPDLPTLRENISSLLFELSDKDANKFVKNIGYGFASGFLMSHNIQIPSNAAEASSTAGEEGSGAAADINPITGQKLSSEESDRAKHEKQDSSEMTEEEKEREAERLFVLFERLKATGVVDVKNPVQQAVDEGRFEELPD
ncbi:Guanine nucleotide exchange factor synembryn [Teratosphaeria destructans]|uniref:Guanine nucleotide exchange factor synembryn n=1 Tax=Teratosphaeria destructans TaxID=418781 RepID=A0A9W7SXL6_9PEZI|nr:Guanine nucleotide exchange factor synembryn [Teratosphaeria destructans]